MLDKKKYISLYDLMKNPELKKEIKPITMKEFVAELRENRIRLEKGEMRPGMPGFGYSRG